MPTAGPASTDDTEIITAVHSDILQLAMNFCKTLQSWSELCCKYLWHYIISYQDTISSRWYKHNMIQQTEFNVDLKADSVVCLKADDLYRGSKYK